MQSSVSIEFDQVLACEQGVDAPVGDYELVVCSVNGRPHHKVATARLSNESRVVCYTKRVDFRTPGGLPRDQLE